MDASRLNSDPNASDTNPEGFLKTNPLYPPMADFGGKERPFACINHQNFFENKSASGGKVNISFLII
jgi:hypothetical protein